MRKSVLLFLIIFIEGYVVLASELLAIRQLIPYVGSGTEVVSIIISAILLPLAVGYHSGGRRAGEELARARREGRKTVSIRRILLRNLMTVLITLTFGLSYIVLELFFGALDMAGLKNRILQTALYSLVFLVWPTYLLAQTVPLVSNYFSQTRLSTITGRMLFFSTTGSFMGSVISTIILMTLIGVHNTVIVTIALVGVLVLLNTKRMLMFDNFMALIFVLVAWGLNSNAVMKQFHIVANTAYSTIAVKEVEDEPGNKILYVNGSWSSKFAADPAQRFDIMRYIEERFLNHLKRDKPAEVLILGAGGFTAGWDDKYNHYTFVDIDPALQEASEQHFLPGPLPGTKKSVVTSARSFLRRSEQKYDFIFVDLFSNIMTIPMESVTREFWLDTRKVLADDGILTVNVISSPNFADKFSVRYYNTFKSVFPVFDHQVLGPFNGWQNKGGYNNTVFVYYNTKLTQDDTIYTEDKNTYSFDH